MWPLYVLSLDRVNLKLNQVLYYVQKSIERGTGRYDTNFDFRISEWASKV